jgi:hypothetical protein
MTPKEAPEPNTFKLSPSDLTYLWDDCPRCFWLRYKMDQRRPGAFPRVFGQIDRAMRNHYEGKEYTVPGFKAGKFDCKEKNVKSDVYAFGEVKLFISGRIDARIVFNATNCVLVDFKCSGDKENAAAKYRYQLGAYALAIEHTLAQKVNGMGLLMFSPVAFSADSKTNAGNLGGEMHWLTIYRNDDAFMGFLSEVAQLLAGESPDPNPECYFCKYTEATKLCGRTAT